MSACAFPGCGRGATRTSLCPAHEVQRRQGKTLAPIKYWPELTAAERVQITAWRAERLSWMWIGRQLGVSDSAARYRYARAPRDSRPIRTMTRYARLRAEHRCTLCMTKMPEAWTETRCKACKPPPSKRCRAKPLGDDDMSGARCRCGLRLPCNNCLPTSAAAYALNRRDNGDAHIAVRSKVA